MSTHLSDHNLITAELTSVSPIHNQRPRNQKADKLRVFNFWSEHAQWDEINKHLQNLQWEENLKSETSVQSDIDFLYDAIS